MGRTLSHRVELRLARQARYAFLVHPRNLADVRRLYPETEPWSDNDLATALDETGPLLLALVSNHEGIDGVVVGAPFDPSMLRKDFRIARSKVRATAEFVGQLGVRYLGLGALSAAFCRYGSDLASETRVVATTGHSLTPWALERLVDAVVAVRGERTTSIAVVGAAGSVGVLTAARLLRAGYRVSLIDVPARADQLRAVCSRFQNASWSTSIADIAEASIVVTATNASGYLLDAANLAPGMVLIDDAQPWCWDHHAAISRFRDTGDILPLEGGLITAPHVTAIEPRYSEHHRVTDIFGCLAEVMALAAHETLSPSVGKNSVENIDERLALSDAYGRAAECLGLSLAPLQCANHIYSEAEIADCLETMNQRTATRRMSSREGCG
jgi:predicted amino acid dehydrogenase